MTQRRTVFKKYCISEALDLIEFQVIIINLLMAASFSQYTVRL